MGGWITSSTGSTVITRSVVEEAYSQLSIIVTDFNHWLNFRQHPNIRLGKLAGSTAHYLSDTDETVYGDIDVQLVAENTDQRGHSAYSRYYNDLFATYLNETQPDSVCIEKSTLGHPILKLSDQRHVQVDFMWHTPELEKWGIARVTPEHKVKGMLHGNMFSVLGEMLSMSIQHAGVQLKLQDDQVVNFQKKKNTTLVTITNDPSTFLSDIFEYLAARQNVTYSPVKAIGIDIEHPSILGLVEGTKTLAVLFEQYDMYSKDVLSEYISSTDFVNQFVERYQAKALAEIESKKRDKATSVEEIGRANRDREKIRYGLEKVLSYFR